jgi:hypothetical protein
MTRSGARSSLLSSCIFPGSSSASAVEATKVKVFSAAEGAASSLAMDSSCTSSSSLESLMMITLPSSSGPRTSRLRSPNNHLANSTSCEVSVMKSSSSEDEDRSIIGTFPEGPPCSNTSERGRHEEISDWDLGGDGDSDGASGGVLVSLGDGLPSVEGERGCLVPLLSSIVGKLRARKGNHKA